MSNKHLDAVKLKRELQERAEQKLVHLSEPEQLKLLRQKFGHLIKITPKRQQIAA